MVKYYKRPKKPYDTDSEEENDGTDAKSVSPVADDKWWKSEKIVYGFNIFRVVSRLEPLMGSNIVQLNSVAYQKALKESIVSDYAIQQRKRIKQRAYDEMIREQRLILKGQYTPDNCKPILILAHSIALQPEMIEARRRLIEQLGDNAKLPPHIAKHPVFSVNMETNAQIEKIRSSLKTNRMKACELLLRKSQRWERDRLRYDELDRLDAEEQNELRQEREYLEQLFVESNKLRKADLIRIKNRDYAECELPMKEYTDSVRESNINRFKPKAPKLNFKSKDIKMRDYIKELKKSQPDFVKSEWQCYKRVKKEKRHLTQCKNSYREYLKHE